MMEPREGKGKRKREKLCAHCVKLRNHIPHVASTLAVDHTTLNGFDKRTVHSIDGREINRNLLTNEFWQLAKDMVGVCEKRWIFRVHRVLQMLFKTIGQKK